MSSRPGEFRPPAWLAHPHVQSIFPSLPFRRPGVERRCAALLSASADEVLDCGEGVRLLSHHATHVRIGREPAQRLVVLLHGWEGSASSLYVLSLGQYLFDRGFDVVRLNLRDHGDSHHLNPGIFHSCRIAEVVGAVQRLQALYPGQSLNLVGFSLGGNFCLRVAARAEAAGIRLARVVAVCPVLDPEHTMARLEAGWVLYRRYFLWKWRRSLRKKQAAWPEIYDLTEALQLGTLSEMTAHLVKLFGDYPTASDYLRGYAVVDATARCRASCTRRASSRPRTTRSFRPPTSGGSRNRRRSRSPARGSAGTAATTRARATAPGSSARCTRR